MAPKKNNAELRQQALRAIAEGRAELRAEVQHVRQQISPARVLQQVFDRHAGLMVFVAFTSGFIPAVLIFRGKQQQHHSLVTPAVKPPPKPVVGALLLGALGMLARSVTPALIKSTVIPHVLDIISRKQSRADSERPSA